MSTVTLLACRFDLRRAKKRQHIVEGLLKAMADLDRVVSIVRAAKDGAVASAQLQQQFGLSAEQVIWTHWPMQASFLCSRARCLATEKQKSHDG
jgi:DNA gyrase/topoisomerase IV subunit A